MGQEKLKDDHPNRPNYSSKQRGNKALKLAKIKNVQKSWQ